MILASFTNLTITKTLRFSYVHIYFPSSRFGVSFLLAELVCRRIPTFCCPVKTAVYSNSPYLRCMKCFTFNACLPT